MSREQIIEVARQVFLRTGWNSPEEIAIRNGVEKMRDLALRSLEAQPDAGEATLRELLTDALPYIRQAANNSNAPDHEFESLRQLSVDIEEAIALPSPDQRPERRVAQRESWPVLVDGFDTGLSIADRRKPTERAAQHDSELCSTLCSEPTRSITEPSGPAVAARPQDNDYRIQCHNCGRPVNYVYCPYCGADPDDAPQEAAPQGAMREREAVIAMLLRVADAAYFALDDCQVDGPDGPIMDTTSHEQLCDAMDELDGLPEPEGFAMTPNVKARAALAASPAGQWVSVPREPTQEMVRAMHERQVEGASHIVPVDIEYQLWVEVYRAMLAASPEPRKP